MDKKLAQDLLDYLGKKPYVEVFQLIVRIVETQKVKAPEVEEKKD
jgi:hypothetical protein